MNRFWGLLPFFLGLLGTIIQNSPQQVVSNISSWCAAAGLPVPRWLRTDNTNKIVKYLSMVLILIGLGWFFFPEIKIKLHEFGIIKIRQVTLQDLFNQQLDHMGKEGVGVYDVDTHIPFSNGTSIALKTKLYMDFNSNTKFISFYIPSIPEIFTITEWIANNSDYVVNKVVEMQPTLVRGIGENFGRSSKDLVFSRRVYIYHETDYSSDEYLHLINLYKIKNLDAMFRGQEYLKNYELRKSSLAK